MDPNQSNYLNPILNGIGSAVGGAAQNIQANPVANFFLGNAMRTANDIGAGISANQTAGARAASTATAEQTAQQLENQAYSSSDPNQRVALLKQANDVRSGISQQAKDVSGTFSRDVNQNPLWRGLKSGVEVGSTAGVVAHPLQTIKGIADVAKGGLNAIAHPIQTLGNISEGISNLPETIQGIPGALQNELNNPMNFKLDKGENALTETGAKVLSSQYKGAGKVVQNPPEVAAQLRQYGLTNSKDISEASDTVNNVFEKKIGQALDTADPVDTTGVLSQANKDLEAATKASPTEKESALRYIKNEIVHALGMGDNPATNEMIANEISGTTPTGAGVNPSLSGADPKAILKATRNLDGLVSDSYSTGDLEDRQLAKVYQNASNLLKDRLYNGLTADPNVMRLGANDLNIASSWTPDELKALSDIHPQLAADAQAQTTVAGLRHLNYPFVQGNQMVEQGAKLARTGIDIPQAIGITGSIATGNPAPAIVGAATSTVGREGIGNALMGLGEAAGGSANLAPAALGIAANQATNSPAPTNPAVPLNQNGPASQVPPGAGAQPQTGNQWWSSNQLPARPSDIKPDPTTGEFTLPPREQIAMSSVDALNQIKELNTQLGAAQESDRLTGQNTAAPISAKISTLQSQQSLSGPIGEYYDKSNMLNAIMSDIKGILTSPGTPTNLLNNISQIKDLRTLGDPKYVALADDLNVLQSALKDSGGPLSQLNPESLPGVGQMNDIALKNLYALNQNMLFNFTTKYRGFASNTGLSAQNNAPTTSNLPLPTVTGLPPIGAGISGSGSAQGKPHPFVY